MSDLVDACIAKGYVQRSRKYRMVGPYAGDAPYSEMVELTPEEWAEFKLKTTGKEVWVPKGLPCPECKSLGHRHAKDCFYAT